MQHSSEPPGKVTNRRKKKLIRLDLQLKIVFITLFVASLVLLINFQLTLAGLWSISNEFLEHRNVEDLIESLQVSTIQKFLFSVAMAIPLAGFIGILYSFKFCGPIFKFKKYFAELVTGRWDERCMLRHGDDLQDVCEAINAAVDGFRSRVRADHALLEEVKSFLDATEVPADSATQAALARIRKGIDEENASFRGRFGAPGSAGTEPGAAGSWYPESVAPEDRRRELEAQV